MRKRLERPRRGAPAETRARIVTAAAAIFRRVGYFATDSNRIARAAGYAPATFYKHFRDKKAVFIAVYRQWILAEWRELDAALDAGAGADALVAIALRHHASALRPSLHALVATDADVRRTYRASRREQLARLERRGERDRERAAFALFAVERVADAIAGGEVSALHLDEDALRRLLVQLVVSLRGRSSLDRLDLTT